MPGSATGKVRIKAWRSACGNQATRPEIKREGSRDDCGILSLVGLGELQLSDLSQRLPPAAGLISRTTRNP